jgi:fructose-bisphosphate aldolase / 2-amino-3,7-dideoxy-D-threo-hept-6-ulosonate synthase
METGKTRRMRRIFRNDGRTVIVPMDHGVSVGPIQGLHDMTDTVGRLVKGGADAILVHAGIAKTVDNGDTGLIVHLSGATRLTGDPNWKTQLTSVREAVRLGADAVSVHINVGSQHEQEMLQSFSRISDECESLGLPTLAMMYPRGPSVSNEHSFEVVSHAARLGYEIGADIVKTNYTGDADSFRKVVQSVKVPVVVAGGPRASKNSEVLSMISESIRAGATGVSIGRNIFQHEDPTIMTNAIVSIVHGNKSSQEAEALLDESNERILA